MRKLFLFSLFISNIFIFSQEQKTEMNTENNSVIYKKAEFPGGDTAFRKELFKMINAYIDIKTYAVNGVFTFSFDVQPDGKIKNLDVNPKVKNSELFIDDMLFCMRKVKTKWISATKDRMPITSNYTIKINFITDHTEHE